MSVNAVELASSLDRAAAHIHEPTAVDQELHAELSRLQGLVTRLEMGDPLPRGTPEDVEQRVHALLTKLQIV